MLRKIGVTILKDTLFCRIASTFVFLSFKLCLLIKKVYMSSSKYGNLEEHRELAGACPFTIM